MARKRKLSTAQRAKVHKTMGEFKRGDLHSGSKEGPRVKSRRQAIAISLNQARRMKKRRTTRSSGRY